VHAARDYDWKAEALRLGESVERKRMRKGGGVLRAEMWDEAGLGFACDGLTREDDKRGAPSHRMRAVIQADELQEEGIK
jgi:hypothetical protein